jgi:hypothetical protein
MSFTLAAGTFTVGTRLVSLGFNVYAHLSTKANNAAGHKKLILRELRDNIKLLERRDIDNINIANLIKGLSNKEIVEGLRDNYNLDKLTRKSKVVHPDMIFRDYEKDYVNWHMK